MNYRQIRATPKPISPKLKLMSQQFMAALAFPFGD
jgi:hypothetical protein